MTESISSHVARCLTRFRGLVDPPDGTELDFPDPGVVLQIIDERSRFKVWAGNIGAHRTGMSSLDYRLRDASHIKSQVINLLKDLTQLIDDASAIARGEQTPWDQHDPEEGFITISDSDDDSPDTEIGQIAVGMADVVNCLLRLTVTIRNPAPHDRYVQAKATDTSHFEHYDTLHVRSKFPDIDPWLAERLGRAISRRRQYLRYRQSHHEKLSRGLDQNELDAGKALEDETVASSIPSHLKEGRVGLAVLKDDGSDAGMSQTSYATSMANPDRLSIPPLPQEAFTGPFECYLCHMIIEVRDRAAWNMFMEIYSRVGSFQICYSSLERHLLIHLLQDVCLERDCVTPERQYLRRHEWIEHAKQSHWKTYKCVYCEVACSSSADCKSHVENFHPTQRSAAELDALMKLSEQRLDIEKGVPCPLCPNILRSFQQYQRHVGRHQEQLSLFALPSLDADGEADDDEQDRGASDTDRDIRDQQEKTYPLNLEVEEEAKAAAAANAAEEAEQFKMIEETLEEQEEKLAAAVKAEREKIETAHQAEGEAKTAAAKKAAEEAEWRKQLEPEAKLKAEEKREAELRERMQKEAEEALKRRMEDMPRAPEEVMKEIERTRIEAEKAARQRLENELKAIEERKKREAEAAALAEAQAQARIELPEEQGKVRARIKAEEKAKAAAAAKVAQEAERLKRIEEDAKKARDKAWEAALKVQKERFLASMALNGEVPR